MLTFKSVGLQGFMNITERQLVKLDKPGLSLVIGKNGSGKSTRYTEGLFWCLFGKTIRGDVSSDEVINKNSKFCSTQVIVEDSSSGEIYYVTRSKHRGTAVVLELSKETKAGGSELLLPAANLAERQTKLEEWLGLDANTFLNSVIFGQGAAAMFASGIMSDGERKQIFDKICDLEDIDQALIVAKTRASTATLEWSVIEGKVSSQDLVVARATTDKDAAEKTYQDTTKAFLIESKRISQDIADEEEAIELQKAEIAKAKLDRAAAVAEIGPEPETTEYTSVIAEAKAYLSSNFDSQQTLNRKLGQVTGSYRTKLDEIKKCSSVNGVCPTCGGPIKALAVDPRPKLVHDAEGLKTLSESLETELKELAITRSEVEELKRNAEAELAKSQIDLVAKRNNVALLDMRIASLSNSLKSMEDSKEVCAGMLEAANNRMRTADSVLQKTVDRYLADLEILAGHKKDLAVANKKLAIAKFWVEAFGPKGIKAYVIENVLPLLNSKLAEHLAELSDGNITAEIKATTSLKKGGTAERLSVTVQNSDGAEVYGGNSGGERRRIDLAILLALQDVVAARAKKGINLVILDEVLDSLDDEGLVRVVNYMKIRSVGKPTYLISHSPTVSAFIEDVVNVEK